MSDDLPPHVQTAVTAYLETLDSQTQSVFMHDLRWTYATCPAMRPLLDIALAKLTSIPLAGPSPTDITSIIPSQAVTFSDATESVDTQELLELSSDDDSDEAPKTDDLAFLHPQSDLQTKLVAEMYVGLLTIIFSTLSVDNMRLIMRLALQAIMCLNDTRASAFQAIDCRRVLLTLRLMAGTLGLIEVDFHLASESRKLLHQLSDHKDVLKTKYTNQMWQDVYTDLESLVLELATDEGLALMAQHGESLINLVTLVDECASNDAAELASIMIMLTTIEKPPLKSNEMCQYLLRCLKQDHDSVQEIITNLQQMFNNRSSPPRKKT